MEAIRGYIERHGKPVAFYSDQHSVFRNAKASAARGDGMTHFGRALDAVNIEIICAKQAINFARSNGEADIIERSMSAKVLGRIRSPRAGRCDPCAP